MNTPSFSFHPIHTTEIEDIKDLMRGVEWPEHYVGVHAKAAEKYIHDDEGEVYVAKIDGAIAGFISMKHQELNALTCVYTLVVGKAHQGQGLGKALLELAVQRAKEKKNRGVFLDTTDNNTPARGFYKAVGFHEAYTMPYYYTDELHGITYLKLFNKKLS